jgi:hypothetical protein
MKETLKAIGIAALIVTVIIVALAAFFLWNADYSKLGDKGYVVSGRAYEWKDAPHDATSKIYLVYYDTRGNIENTLEHVLAANINDINIVPVEDASILFGPKSWVEDKGWGYFESHSPYASDKSDKSGDFNVSWFGSTRPEVFLIKISKSGYKEAVEEADMSSSNTMAMVAILVK